jgi:hypothetical protein
MKKIMNFKVVDLVKLHEFYVFFCPCLIFFRKRRRIRIIILRREKGKSPNNPTNTKRTHALTAPPVEEITIVPGKTHKTTELNT